jgi:hypothetical protein
MTPPAALEAQIARYRAMTREERVALALRLHELACEMARLRCLLSAEYRAIQSASNPAVFFWPIANQRRLIGVL